MWSVCDGPDPGWSVRVTIDGLSILKVPISNAIQLLPSRYVECIYTCHMRLMQSIRSSLSPIIIHSKVFLSPQVRVEYYVYIEYTSVLNRFHRPRCTFIACFQG